MMDFYMVALLSAGCVSPLAFFLTVQSAKDYVNRAFTVVSITEKHFGFEVCTSHSTIIISRERFAP